MRERQTEFEGVFPVQILAFPAAVQRSETHFIRIQSLDITEKSHAETWQSSSDAFPVFQIVPPDKLEAFHSALENQHGIRHPAGHVRCCGIAREFMPPAAADIRHGHFHLRWHDCQRVHPLCRIEASDLNHSQTGNFLRGGEGQPVQCFPLRRIFDPVSQRESGQRFPIVIRHRRAELKHRISLFFRNGKIQCRRCRTAVKVIETVLRDPDNCILSFDKQVFPRTVHDDCFGHFPALVQIMHTADKFVRNNDFIFFPDGAERREFSAEFMTSHFFPFQQKIKVLKKLWHLLLQNRSAYPILFVIGIR